MMKGFLREKHKEDEKKPTRYFSKQQEKEVAKSLGGRTTKNSGATMFGGKGDILLTNWTIEAKTKTSHAESISIKKEWLEKNRKEALFDGKKYNALVFSFGPNEENYYVIDENLFKELIYYLDNTEKEE